MVVTFAEGILIREISARIAAADDDSLGDVEIVWRSTHHFRLGVHRCGNFDHVAGLRGIHRGLDRSKVRPAGLADMPFVHLRQRNHRA